MGRVLDALERNGLTDNTLVICTTDHGIPFPGMKSTLTDHGIGVMQILRGPRSAASTGSGRAGSGQAGGFTGGKVVDAMVSQIDLYPTICDLVGIATPEWVQGCSMMPLINGEKTEINDAVFAEITYHAAYEPVRCVRTRRWKYIRRFDGRTKAVLSNLDDGLSKEYWYRNGWTDQKVAEEMLFDLIFDPHERCNVIDRDDLRETAAEMRNRLDTWMRETHDPLLDGPVPPPPGATVTDPDDYSPRHGWPEYLKKESDAEK